ncbi:Phi-29-like late activator, partial [Enterococcus faecalis]|nr:Phi-29-like late activator [Enterococcus faecalis]
TVKEKAIWEEFFSVKKIYDKELSEFSSFKEKYKYFEPKNSEELKQQARVLLEKKGYIVDSPFEGDFERWIGVYARPKDKPTYLDPRDGEEVGLQEVYSVDGFKQDFAEWFEGEIVEGKVKEML